MASSQIAMSVDRSALQTRRLSNASNRSDSLSSLTSTGEMDVRESARPNVRPPLAKRSASGSGSRDGDTSSPDDADEEAADGDDEPSDEEADEIAPSGVPKKRGHQTGLSVSLSNTSLGKRGRSPGTDEELERPMSKMSKTSANADSSDDDDDDDGYGAVDDISESEEEDDVEKMEEKMIIESEEEDVSDPIRRHSQSSLDSFLGFEGGDDDAFQAGNQTFFNELFPEASHAVHQDEVDDVPVTRRVRFADDVKLHSSSSTETDDDDEEEELIYPDLFLPQSSLDRDFRNLIEQRDQDDRSSDGDSYWDFENEQDVRELDRDSGSETGSSGYETDEGETTDEEIIPPRTVSKPQTSLRQSAKPLTRLRAPAATPTRKGPAAMRRGPLMGSFLVDDDKPIAVVDGHGKHMLFFPAPKHRRQAAQAGTVATSSPGASALSAYSIMSENESDVGFSQTDPMLSSPANAMMSSFGHSRARPASALSSEITGPPEAFFPFTSISSNGAVETDNIDDEDSFDEYSDEEDNLRIEDFINFGDDSSSEDDSREQSENTDSNNTATEEVKDVEKTPQPKRSKIPGFKSRLQFTPTPASSGSLLEHFDKGVVSSFRRNNDRHKMWTRSPSDAGIKGSRLHAADVLISPLRRRRGGSISAGVGRSPLRPQSSSINGANMAATQSSPQHRFGGPLKKRIQNSNHIRRGRKGTL